MVYTSLSALINSIKQEVGQDANKISRGVAQVAYEDLQIAHMTIMDEYYNGYTPVTSYQWFWEDPDGRLFSGISHGYRRTGNLKNSLQPQGVFPSGRHGFKATINVDSSEMEDYVGPTKKRKVFPASSVLDLIWNQGIRGLPPGNIGHIEKFSINAFPVGVQISGTPNEAMSEFVQNWGNQRGAQVADMIAFNI